MSEWISVKDSLRLFINTDDIPLLNKLPNFVPVYEYIDEQGEYDPREWGRLYFQDDYVTVLAASNIK